VTRRRADTVAVVGGLSALVLCAIPASTGRVGELERAVFEAINGLPGTLEPVMVGAQFLGVLAIVIAVGAAAVAATTGDSWAVRSILVLVAGDVAVRLWRR